MPAKLHPNALLRIPPFPEFLICLNCAAGVLAACTPHPAPTSRMPDPQCPLPVYCAASPSTHPNPPRHRRRRGRCCGAAAGARALQLLHARSHGHACAGEPPAE
eukprot:364164-Chlamydomonas_euryale.AAC.5